MKLKYEPARFPWLDRPSDAAIAVALEKLRELGACDDACKEVTAFGELALTVEQNPSAAKVLDLAYQEGRLRSGAILAALTIFGGSRFFFFGNDDVTRAQAESAHAKLIGDTAENGDLIAMYHVFGQYCAAAGGSGRQSDNGAVAGSGGAAAEEDAEMPEEPGAGAMKTGSKGRLMIATSLKTLTV